MMKKSNFLLVLIVGLLVFSGCSAGNDLDNPADQAGPAADTPAPDITVIPTSTFTPQPSFTPSATPIVILDPEPIQVEFTASDGQELSGIYYLHQRTRQQSSSWSMGQKGINQSGSRSQNGSRIAISW